jgi:hypothetical protein
MKTVNSLIVAALLGSVTVNAGHFSWGVSIGFGGGYCAPVYVPPPVICSPVVYQPQVVVVPQPIVRQVVCPPPVVIVPQPVVYYSAPTIWVGGSHVHGRGHGHRR